MVNKTRTRSAVKYEESEDEEFTSGKRVDTSKIRKKRKGNNEGPLDTSFSVLRLDSLLDSHHEERDFDELIGADLDEYLECRRVQLESSFEQNPYGQRVRPLTRLESYSALREQESRAESSDSTTASLLQRKLKLEAHRRGHSLREPRILMGSSPTLQPLPRSAMKGPDPAVINALKEIKTTPYECSLAARIAGLPFRDTTAFISRDWNTRSPWMDLMDDIREHYSLAHPDSEQPTATRCSIDYQTLHVSHLLQVHDLLERAFWPGIDVSDSFQYAPEQCTVIATYNRLVVGAAFISSPEETYITYLVVRAGWEGTQIATTMLYHLITSNPRKDIILHVSANNPAMLLYNRYGFKAEEFIVGFYEDYLDKQARASKNAFRLRLRR